jgi:hypothetical protein
MHSQPSEEAVDKRNERVELIKANDPTLSANVAQSVRREPDASSCRTSTGAPRRWLSPVRREVGPDRGDQPSDSRPWGFSKLAAGSAATNPDGLIIGCVR